MFILNTFELHIPAPAPYDVTLVIVLTQNADDKYTVYWAANCTKEYAAHSTKLNYSHAALYFPSLKEEDYLK